MLENITVDQVKEIAALARDLRDARDAMLKPTRETDLEVAKPMRGERDPAAAYGLSQFPPDDSRVAALRNAIAALSADARQELQALMWLGSSDYGPNQLPKAVADAGNLLDDVIVGNLMDRADLHDDLAKALYELGLA
jgi:hypothetical protein